MTKVRAKLQYYLIIGISCLFSSSNVQSADLNLWVTPPQISLNTQFNTLLGISKDDNFFIARLGDPKSGVIGFSGNGKGPISFCKNMPCSYKEARLFHSQISKSNVYYGAMFDSDIGANKRISTGFTSIYSEGVEPRLGLFTGIEIFKKNKINIFKSSNSNGISSHSIMLNIKTPVGDLYSAFLKSGSSTSAGLLKLIYPLGVKYSLSFDMKSGNSSRYRDGDYSSVMISISSRASSRGSIIGNQEIKDYSNLMNAALLATAAVGVALVASSGDSDTDGQIRFSTQHDAARNVLNAINPTSVAENREYGGWVYRNSDQTYSATEPNKGTSDSVILGSPLAVPDGSVTTASYHTHAAFDTAYDNENFSLTDLALDVAWEFDGYLGTPAGYFKYHNYLTGVITTLGTIAN